MIVRIQKLNFALRLFLLIGVAILGMLSAPELVHAADSENQRLRFDIGASTGKRDGVSYTEANLGINLQLLKGLIWRNSLWGRFQSEVKEQYGIDTSIRAVLDVGDTKNGASLFVAPGYRFTTETSIDPAPFGEAGVTVRAGGISIGGSIKTIFNEWVRNGIENDTQYTVTLGGGFGV